MNGQVHGEQGYRGVYVNFKYIFFKKLKKYFQSAVDEIHGYWCLQIRWAHCNLYHRRHPGLLPAFFFFFLTSPLVLVGTDITVSRQKPMTG